MAGAAFLAAAAVLHAQTVSPVPVAESAPTTPPPPVTTTSLAPAADDIVELSPFEVVGETKGYYAANTMSGTRLNAKIEDLGAAISVVTKEQMSDFAMLDINDIFSYEVSTEGTRNFTDFSFNSSGQPIDNSELNPQGANRIRGLASANVNYGNFETSGRIPIDPTNIDGVEVSRGPNASIFGIGSPAGAVNSLPASANLQRDAAHVVLRTDDLGGYYTSLDVNRVFARGVFAVRGSVVDQHEEFVRKPSSAETHRLNAMAKYRPFKNTTLSASFSRYQFHGSRPNNTTPRDAITGWRNAGAPTWDPVTSTVHINGATVGTYASSTPVYFNTTSMGYAQAYVDEGGLSYLGTGRTTSTTTPTSPNQSVRLMAAQPDPSGFLAAQPLWPDYPAVSSKEVYDWSAVNVSATNRVRDDGNMAYVLLEQMFIDSGRQRLGLQLGWFHEEGDRWARNTIGSTGASANVVNALQVDVNERMLDGSPNPYFGRPFIGVTLADLINQPIDRNTYRTQLAYQLDLRREKSWVKWLGMHQLSSYAEYKDFTARSISYRNAVVSNNAWASGSVGRASDAATNLANSPSLDKLYERYYVGDASGYNVDYAPTMMVGGTYPLVWGNGVTGSFTREPVEIQEAVSNQYTSGRFNTRTLIKTQGAILQNYLLNDRVITTFGVRRDKQYAKTGSTFAYLPDGTSVDRTVWASFPGDWTISDGRTTTAGVVVKPLRWMSLYVNRSNSFQPADIAYGLHRAVLPNPTGHGEDYGVSFNLFEGKLIARINRYKTTQIDVRNSDSANIAQRMYRLDFPVSSSAFVLQNKATSWVTAAAAAEGRTLTVAETNQQVANIMKLPVSYVETTPRASATDDMVARGTEVELNYNPTPFWTLKLNVGQQESANQRLSAEVSQWLAERMPVWQSVIDPTINRPWFTERYNNSQSASEYLAGNVLTPLAVAQAMVGKSRPQVREYRVNCSTNFRLGGITEQRWLKNVSVGGAMRWEDKGAIGYYGVEQLPAIVTTLDVNRPIWDKAHTYFDAFVTYKLKLFSRRVGTSVQLNVRNLTEGGRLQAIAAAPDGSATAYRIVDPRSFILTVKFDL